MAYTEVRILNRNKYYYRVTSIRKGHKISKKRIYLGSNLLDLDIQEKEKIADKQLLSKKTKKTKKEIKKIKSKIIRILKKNKVKKAGIFGSYSRGEQKKDSDIDIVVDIDDDQMSLLGFVRLNRLLEEALKRKVDLVEYSAIKPIIKENMLKDEIRII